MNEAEFRQRFNDLTGKAPLHWQWRLFDEHFARPDSLCGAIDLPTGLGKTMAMAIWLIARGVNKCLPRRLVYVVDRRTVIDQATDLAIDLQAAQKALGKEDLAISTLRGQRADNREWSRDPSKPAIIIGTVDLIGSALLFSGYRSSYKRRPLEAGLLGQDSLLVLDEAHLSKPFEKLLDSIARFQTSQGSPMRVIRMSATSEGSSSVPSQFVLDTDPESPGYDLRPDPDPATGKERNQIITRFTAAKRLKIEEPVEPKRLCGALAGAAIKLAKDHSLVGKRIVVFVRSPESARAITEAIRCHDRPRKSDTDPNPKGPYADSVEVLTGTMRGLERDELVRTEVFEERWLHGDLEPSDESNQRPVFLVSTSAGEVGFDLNADHLVSDQTTIESFLQRLGRVNRRGTGDATVILIPEVAKNTEKGGKPRPLDQAIANTLALLAGRQGMSPEAIDTLKKNEWKDGYIEACSPPPAMVELTDILLDAWSMTSIAERMPGRPEVAPWLRGIADDQPQTTIAWRAELGEPGFAGLGVDDIEEWFDMHRVLAHETLSVPTSDAAKWFVDRWNDLLGAEQSRLANRPIIVDRAGVTVITVKSLIDRLVRKAAEGISLIRSADLIVPASFGGVERGSGLLDHLAPRKRGRTTSTAGEQAELTADASDVGDLYLIERYRCIQVRTEDGGLVEKRIGPGSLPDESTKKKLARLKITLNSDDDGEITLISYVPKPERLDWGTERQTLAEHVGLVRETADTMVSRLSLPSELLWAARLAAEWHDHGKNRERWQRCAGRTESEAPLGKSGGRMKRDPRGYRHEFGSLREFTDAFNAGDLLDENGTPVGQDVFDLAMHLIATHHGRGRPHFPKGGFDPDCEPRSDKIHTESIQRFARLQRKYGWWQLAWLENLLRCADAIASAQVNGGANTGGKPERS